MTTNFNFYKQQFDNIRNFPRPKNIDDAWRKEYWALVEENLYVPIREFLIAKRRDLKPIKYSETHNNFFINNWNKFLAGEDLNVDRIFSKLVRENYDTIISTIQNGNIDSYMLPECTCFECGQRLEIFFKEWEPALYNVEYSDKFAYTPAKPCIEDRLYGVDVEFPTGEILASDWFRIPAFNSVEDTNYEQHKSLNHTAGRIYNTERYAREFNFVCINVGNSSPHIYQNGNSLIFAADKPKGYKERGYVCTDFWGVTLIDKAQMLDILYKEHGSQSEVVLEDYIKENHINTLHVTPGTYTVEYYPGNKDKQHLSVNKKPKPQYKL